MDDVILYAIGDVHGEAERLTRLHDKIAADIALRRAPALIAHLGDVIDRGPDSAGALERVIALQAAPPPWAEAMCLRGNHEQMLLDALSAPHLKGRALRQWVTHGGAETLASYGVPADPPPADWPEALPATHRAFLEALPMRRLLEARKIALVHAGIDPHTFPEDDAATHLWTRTTGFLDDRRWPDRPTLAGWRVVHGHTALKVPVPEVTDRRINVDTGACYGGPLTAVVLAPGEPPRFLQVYRPAHRSARRRRSGERS